MLPSSELLFYILADFVARQGYAKMPVMSGYAIRPKYIGTHNVLLILITLVGFALRLYKLGAQSLWYDETVSAYLAAQPVADLVAHTTRDIHPPGYYLLLHYWQKLSASNEFALAFFSLIFGLLLIPLVYTLGRYLINQHAAIWAAALVAISPYNIWYSQEVRMYTLGAVLGVLAAYCALHGLEKRLFRYWLGYVTAAAIGLYTLYYFAFLLMALNLLFLFYLLYPKINTAALRAMATANGLVFIAYLPWIPVAWRQATNPPVPPWRSLPAFWAVAVESWSALALGQSVEAAVVWPILLFVLALFLAGLYFLFKTRSPKTQIEPALFLLTYIFGPLLLIYLFSFVTPLYHVRYLFTYSPAFYIVLGAGIAWLATRIHFGAALMAALILAAAALYSLYQFHFDARYRSDDFRAAVHFIRQHYRPGDVILTNAGYTYTAFVYYADSPNLERRRLVPYSSTDTPLLLQAGAVDGSPQLGWGHPQSDFYAMSAAETTAALTRLTQDYPRLWLLRAYDTVTDANGLIRAWLAENAILLEDELFSGESNIRAQGFLLAGSPQPQNQAIPFEDGMTLAGWQLPLQTWQAGDVIPLQIWWMTTAVPQADYKMSLKLWTPGADLAAQGEDEWPVGHLYRATQWPVGQVVYHPTQLALPQNLPPGEYWLNVELYHPDTVQPLPRRDNGEAAVTLGSVMIRNEN